MNNIEAAIYNIENSKPVSAWGKGVKDTAIDLLDLLDVLDENVEITEAQLLNGAADWEAYSYGGLALIYNEDIAEAYCTPSELKRCRQGELMPNIREDWCQLQARALRQAWRLIQANV